MFIARHIAGTSHRPAQSVKPGLPPGAFLVLKREPDNPHDGLTTMTFDQARHLLGYLPRAQNATLARLMDAGKLLFGRLGSKVGSATGSRSRRAFTRESPWGPCPR